MSGMKVKDQIYDKELAKLMLEKAGVQLHETQEYVFDYFFSQRDDVIIKAGRRWGKSFLAAAVILYHVLTYPEPKVWIVAPERWQSRKVLGYLEKMCQNLGIHFYMVPGEEVLAEVGDTVVYGKVSTSQRGLVGEGLTLVVEDEAALSTPEHYFEKIEPSLLDYDGRALFLTSPYTRSWIDDLANAPGFKMFEYPNWMNPHISLERILRAKEVLPENLFKAMYGGETVADNCKVFDNMPVVQEVDESELVTPPVIGIDWGYYSPFAAVMVWLTRERKFYIQKEVYATGLNIRQQVLAVREMAGRWFDEALKVADPSVFIRSGDVSIASQWANNGLMVVKGTKDLSGSLQMLLELLADERIIVSPKCQGLLHEMSKAEVRIEKPDDIIQDDHAIDALRYAITHAVSMEIPKVVPVGSLEWLELLEMKQRGREYVEWRSF